MGRFLRYLLIAAVAVVTLAPATVHADSLCNPYPECLGTPPPGTPTPPKTPTPTAKPTTKPVATTAPTHHYVPPPVNNTTSNSSVDNSTPEPTPFPVDSVSPAPAATTVIETQTLPGDTTQSLNAENSASASSWIFGFIVGLLIGLLVGRASWGIKRRRRQQIFG